MKKRVGDQSHFAHPRWGRKGADRSEELCNPTGVQAVGRESESLRRGIASITATRGGILISQALSFIFLARGSSSHVVAAVGVCYALWALARALLPVGWDLVMLKSVGALRGSGNDGAAANLLYLGLRDTTTSWLLSIAVATPIFLTVTRELTELILAELVGLVWAHIGILSSYLRSFSSVAKTQAMDGLASQLAPQCWIILATLAGVRVDVIGVIIAFLVGGLIGLAGLWRMIVGRSAHRRGPGFEQRNELRQLARRLWLGQLMGQVASRVATVATVPVAGVVAGSVIEGGLRIQQVGGTIAWVMGTVLSPRYAMPIGGKIEDRARLLRFSIWGCLAPTTMIAIAFGCWGERILYVLGSAYSGEWLAFLVMAIAGAVDSVGASTGYFFAMTGLENAAMKISGIQLLTSLGGIVLLGSQLGALGCAAALLLASAMKSGAAILVLRRNGVIGRTGLPGSEERRRATWRSRSVSWAKDV